MPEPVAVARTRTAWSSFVSTVRSGASRLPAARARVGTVPDRWAGTVGRGSDAVALAVGRRADRVAAAVGRGADRVALSVGRRCRLGAPAVVVVTLVAAGCLVTVPGVADAATNRWASYHLGVDVSSYQHPGGKPIDWWAARQAGVRFAVIKATEGPSGSSGTYTNSWFARDFAAAGAAGIARGAYHYARPRYPLSSATGDADTFVAALDHAGARWSELGPVLDLEESGGLSPSALVAWVQRWLDEVQRRTGRIPVIYTARWVWRSYLGMTTQLRTYPLWVEEYASALGPLPGSWTRWRLWQYTAKGQVPGIPAPVDLSVGCPGSGAAGTGGSCAGISDASWVAAHPPPPAPSNGRSTKPPSPTPTTTAKATVRSPHR
jgi:GH25 family lysozyme M1 (1,4-beta-N-acetylmuramidase)